MFIDTVPEDQATGAVAEMYAREREQWGFLPGFTRIFSHDPAAYEAWRGLIGATRRRIDRRTHELATLAAAQALRSSCCAVAHGKLIRDRFHDADTVRRMVTDRDGAGLSEVDVAVMDFAEQVAREPASITWADVDRLRSLGLGDEEVFDVVLAAAARCFFATVLEALGVPPEPELAGDLEPELRDALLVGRPG